MNGADEHEVEEASRERDVRLQRIINDLVRQGGRSHAEIVEEFTAAIDRAGLAAMPGPWVEAVADEVAQGNPYVVSAHAAEATDVPSPSTHTPTETIE